MSILDIILAIYTSVLAYKSARRLLGLTSSSFVDYVIIIMYIFNALPIIMNILLGLPQYELIAWYDKFELAATNSVVNMVYDIYVIVVFFSLSCYSKRNNTISSISVIRIQDSFTLSVLVLTSVLPFILAILFGHYEAYLSFMSSSWRGLEPGQTAILMFFEIIALVAFHCWFFIGKSTNRSYWILVLYDFLIIWIDGKRYLMATIVLLFIFFYLNSEYRVTKKVNLRALGMVVLPLFLGIYVIYAFAYKINDNVADLAKEMTYLSFRIDFGRDDVTKCVLYDELVEKHPILDYRGQSLLSTVLFWVPRSIWPTKPFPHYRYLTASIYNITLDEVHSGMTPSLYEMSIANFGVIIGIVMTIVTLILLIRYFDKSKSMLVKAFGIIILESLLTQSLDAISSIIIVWMFVSIFKIRIGKFIKIS